MAIRLKIIPTKLNSFYSFHGEQQCKDTNAEKFYTRLLKKHQFMKMVISETGRVTDPRHGLLRSAVGCPVGRLL